MLIERAPAKINLTLHVLGRRDDGWHDIESLVAFAGAGDLLTLTPDANLSFAIDGPTASAAGAPDDNLVLAAVRDLGERIPHLMTGRFHLRKRLPVAAGVGGGSADAAAALRLLARVNDLHLNDSRLLAAAAAVGADVPVCLAGGARMMRGTGEQLEAPIHLPPLFAVLVNPGVPLETRAVFRRMGLQRGATTNAGRHPAVASATTFEALIAALRRGRNDMEAAACTLVPAIGDVLAVIGAAPRCALARMSGSGATCFGLFPDCRSAARAAHVIRRDHPGWWAKATILR